MAWLFIRADRCFSRFGNKPMLCNGAQRPNVLTFV